MERRRSCQRLCFGVAGLLLLPTCPVSALEDVLPGHTVWLQGYDLNPTSAPFRNEGILRLECIDDALPITLSVSDSGLFNAEGGLVLVAAGAGGSREYRGTLRNHGEIRINYGILFTGVGRVVQNEAAFRVSDSAAAWFLGPGLTLEQNAGALEVGGGLEVRDGEFRLVGGDVVGEPRMVRSRMTVADSVTRPFAAVMAGDGGRYEGRLRTGQTLRLVASPDQGWSRTRLTLTAPMEGTVILTSEGAAGAALLETGDGLRVEETGVLRSESGMGGAREIRGPLDLGGALEVRSSSLVLKQEISWRPRGRVSVESGAMLEVPSGIDQQGGLLELRGGRVRSATGMTVHGGVLAGSGAVGGSLTNFAEIRAGGASGPLRIQGDFEQGTGARVMLFTARDPAGSAPTPLQISADARLAGAIGVATPPGMTWRAGDRLPLLSARRIFGGVESLELPVLGGGLRWHLDFKDGVLTAVVADGSREPHLVMEVGPDGRRRLRMDGGLPLGLALERSIDLTTWTPAPVRIEFDGESVVLAGWESAEDVLSVFFRRVAR